MDQRDALADHILRLIPVFHRKLIKKVKMHKFKQGEFMLLNKLMHDGGRPMSEYGELLSIEKPNLTKLVNSLRGYGWVEKKKDQQDKRITRLDITAEGKAILMENYGLMKQQVLESISELSDEDISILIHDLEEVHTIFQKLEDMYGED